MRGQPNGARLCRAALEVSLALEDLEMVMDGRGGREPDGERDLPNRRRITPCSERGRDVVEDLDLAFSVVASHPHLLSIRDDTEQTFDVKLRLDGAVARNLRLWLFRTGGC